MTSSSTQNVSKNATDVWPNITGGFRSDVGLFDSEGAFYIVNENPRGGISGSYLTTRANIDASRSSQIYKGSTLQPKAGLTLLCIKA